MKIYLLNIFLIALLIGSQTPCLAELQLEGNLSQGGLLFGHIDPETQVFYGDDKLMISADGFFILGFDRDAALSQSLTTIDANGTSQEHPIALKKRHYNIQKITGISKKMMNPSEEDLQRIGIEAKQVTKARKQRSSRLNFQENFIWPVIGRISGVYGSQRFFNDQPRRPHFGIDIAAPTGTSVKAPAGGLVTLAHQGMFYSGSTMIIDHGHGLSSSFLHLDKILVEEGTQISQGEVVAMVGATGRVTGPHLDWRINWFDQRLDPALLVPPMPSK